MSIFEHAKEVELNGINFYQDELKRTKVPELKKILQTLIDEEQDHYIFLDSIQHNFMPEGMRTSRFDELKNVFQRMRMHKENLDLTEEQIEVYRKALDIEKRSENFYRNEAQKIENENVKDQLLMVAEKEKKHVMLTNLLIKCFERPY